ncbi:MAG TPA: hypothetical protein VMU83_00830 [Hanamia sp.]|nr:hypothetical protein [Hanamia sp.]
MIKDNKIQQSMALAKTMNTNNLLDEILLMLRAFKDNRELLEKLHQYMLNELYKEDDAATEAISIPERFASFVKDTADSLSAGLVCYINLATLEKIEIPQSVVDTIILDEEDADDDAEEEDPFYEDLKRIDWDWEQTITINPPESHVSFSFMERFVGTLPESNLSKMLSEALSGRKPFLHFNHIIHQSLEREVWFAFRKKCLENYVAGILAERLWNNKSGN